MHHPARLTAPLALLAVAAGLTLTGCAGDKPADPAPEDTSSTTTDSTPAEETQGGDVVSLSVPEGWEEQDLGEPMQTVDEQLQFAMPEDYFARNVTVIVYAANPAAPDDYLERLEAGADQYDTTYEEIPSEEVDGVEFDGYESETDYGNGLVHQKAYGAAIDSGQFVEIVFSDTPEKFDSHQGEFDGILSSVSFS